MVVVQHGRAPSQEQLQSEFLGLHGDTDTDWKELLRLATGYIIEKKLFQNDIPAEIVYTEIFNE